MRRGLIGLIVLGILAGPRLSPAGAGVSADQVRRAIERGGRYIESQQESDGSWPERPGFDGGSTALATLTLLNCGAKPEDPNVRKSLDYLRRLLPDRTYVTALQTMVFALAEPERSKELIRRNVRALEKTQIVHAARRGAWAYPAGLGDNSNSQFALLALHEAERIGVEADRRTWQLAKTYWEDCQNPDGSWGYYKGAPGTGSMTCAGIASLIIASGVLDRGDARAVGNRIECCESRGPEADAVERGVGWLTQHFSVQRNPGREPPQLWLLYYLYGMERVGRLTARRFIGQHDWYREGADHLLALKGDLADTWKLAPDPEARPAPVFLRRPDESDDLIATCFALLFLSKGRRPVLLAKLKHGDNVDWNHHRSDVAYLTRHVESKWKRELTWQVFDLDAATVDDLVQSPVLYLCGKNSPLPSGRPAQDELARRLRDYLDRGGFLLAEAYCGGAAFDLGFRQLMKLAFPEPEYELHLLPPEHPIWRAEERIPPEHIRPLYGIEFGCRTSVVYSPVDVKGHAYTSLSCLWELSHPGRDRETSKPVQAKIDAALAIGLNLMSYATDRQVKHKDEIPSFIQQRIPDTTPRRGQIYVANVRHPGGCSAAPRALVNLLEAGTKELGLHLVPEERRVALVDDELFDYHLIFMHGRTAFRLTDLERSRLKLYLKRGGILFADSICSSPTFTVSFRKEIATIFPGRSLEPIPADDPLLTTVYGGFDLPTVNRRDWERPGGNAPPREILRSVAPELESMTIDGRHSVIFSPYDLSCALDNGKSTDCQGYLADDAAKIGLNVLLYSLQR